MKIEQRDIGILHDEDLDQHSIAFCRICARFGRRSPLGPRQNYNERDFDKWKECTYCRRIFPIYEIKHEGKLVGLLEPEENPFKSTGSVEGLDNKNFDKKEIAKRKLKEKIKNERDPEVRALLKQGYDVTYNQ